MHSGNILLLRQFLCLFESLTHYLLLEYDVLEIFIYYLYMFTKVVKHLQISGTWQYVLGCFCICACGIVLGI